MRGTSPQAAVDPPREEGKQAKEGGYHGEDRKRVRDRGVAPAHGHDVLEQAQQDVAERFGALVHKEPGPRLRRMGGEGHPAAQKNDGDLRRGVQPADDREGDQRGSGGPQEGVDRVPQGIHPGHLIREELHDGADACGAQHIRVGEYGKGGEFLRKVEQPVPKAKPDREDGRVETDSGEKRDPRHRSKERERLHCPAEADEDGTRVSVEPRVRTSSFPVHPPFRNEEHFRRTCPLAIGPSIF